jgi:periplasmic protein TonB
MPNPSLRLIAAAAIALVLPLAAQDPKANTQPRLIRKVEPQYSEQARKDKIEGTVTLKAVVAADGHPTDIKVLKSLDPELDQNAIAAVKEYLFKPATKNGEPVAVFATVEVPFRLK